MLDFWSNFWGSVQNNRAFDHAFVIREKNIYSHESILMPGQYSRFPVAKAALLFLMTGNDYDDGVEYEKPEIYEEQKQQLEEIPRKLWEKEKQVFIL